MTDQMTLYPFQLEANRNLWRTFLKENSSLLQAPCGSGKTLMASHFIAMRRAHKQEKAIVFAHRREIVTQTAGKLEAAGLTPEIIMAGHAPNPWANVWVASVDTVWAAHKRGQSFPEAQLVVIDECHSGILAPRYQKIIEHYKAHGAVLLGMTATPMGKDGVGLGSVFSSMVRTPDTPWMIENGYLCPPIYRIGEAPEVDELKLKGYTDKQIEEIMDRKVLIGDVVENWLLYAKDRATIVFASGVKHSMHLVEEFIAAGVRAVHIDGETPNEIRDDVYRKSQSGEIQVICNAQVYVEGTDFPWINCVVDACLTYSLTRYLQKLWRAGRAFPGKTDFLVLDHANNVWRHGRLELPRNWELTAGKVQQEKLSKERKDVERAQIKCKICGFLLLGPVCQHCGAMMERKGRAENFLPGLLIEMSINDYEKTINPQKAPKSSLRIERSEEQAFYSGLIDFGQRRGWKPGWAKNKFKERFGVWPVKLEETPMTPRKAVRDFIRESQKKWYEQQKLSKAKETASATQAG